ncbi:hypothetical protein HHI36_006930, partial [Cryptolaemus montrouzieri]
MGTKLIGLKLLLSSLSPFLYIPITPARFQSTGNLLDANEMVIILASGEHIAEVHVFRNFELKPSKPGELSVLRFLMYFMTDSSVKSTCSMQLVLRGL